MYDEDCQVWVGKKTDHWINVDMIQINDDVCVDCVKLFRYRWHNRVLFNIPTCKRHYYACSTEYEAVKLLSIVQHMSASIMVNDNINE